MFSDRGLSSQSFSRALKFEEGLKTTSCLAFETWKVNETMNQRPTQDVTSTNFGNSSQTDCRSQ